MGRFGIKCAFRQPNIPLVIVWLTYLNVCVRAHVLSLFVVTDMQNKI